MALVPITWNRFTQVILNHLKLFGQKYIQKCRFSLMYIIHAAVHSAAPSVDDTPLMTIIMLKTGENTNWFAG